MSWFITITKRVFKKTVFMIPLLIFLVSQVHLSEVYAEKVTPKETVTNHVNIRANPLGTSDLIGILRPGEFLDYLESVPQWHKVKTPSGQQGYVSKGWTVVVPDPVDVTVQSPFAVHFLDVGVGDSAIIDMGDKEIIIDGGETLVLNSYARDKGLIDGPIELVIVTHADGDHWKGFNRLLGFDGVEDTFPDVLEFWDAGYDRDCNAEDDGGKTQYLAFIRDMKSRVVPSKYHRPLETTYSPAVDSDQVQPFTVSSLPGVKFTLLHSDSTPSHSDCPFEINNASIVLMIEIEDVRFLFAGDANGKDREDEATVSPKYVEEKLLALEKNHPGVLKVDVLKVPHHGSETASTQDYIKAVDPNFVIISASTKHNLPKDSVIDRYKNGQRIILRTDADRKNNNDHIVCFKANNKMECKYEDILNE